MAWETAWIIQMIATGRALSRLRKTLRRPGSCSVPWIPSCKSTFSCYHPSSSLPSVLPALLHHLQSFPFILLHNISPCPDVLGFQDSQCPRFICHMISALAPLSHQVFLLCCFPEEPKWCSHTWPRQGLRGQEGWAKHQIPPTFFLLSPIHDVPDLPITRENHGCAVPKQASTMTRLFSNEAVIELKPSKASYAVLKSCSFCFCSLCELEQSRTSWSHS